jgi:hypothetical protein
VLAIIHATPDDDAEADSEDAREDLPGSPSFNETWYGSQTPERQTIRTVRSSTPIGKCPSPPFEVSVALDATTYESHSPRPQDESQLKLQLSDLSDDSSQGSGRQNVA